MDAQCISAAYKQLAVLLHQAVGVGPQTVLRIIYHLQDLRIKPNDLWVDDSVVDAFSFCTKKQIKSIHKVINVHTIYSFYDWLAKQNIRVITRGEAEYPPRFEQLAQPPLIMYIQGVWPIAPKPVLAVVGARRCTPYGLRATKVLVADSCAGGVRAIVSGLMYGIDAAAHRAALLAGVPTVAVLGYGLGFWFPRSMAVLGQAILAAGGTLLSEYSPGMPPNRGTFLERNRLVAALSDAVLVPEAAARSGTQRTVSVAAELGIPVGAVPGPFDSPLSMGTKVCINQGATLVTSATDILEELGLIDSRTDPTESLHPIEQLLQSGPLNMDQLCLTLQQTVVQLSFELSSLELAGRIMRRGAEWYRV